MKAIDKALMEAGSEWLLPYFEVAFVSNHGYFRGEEGALREKVKAFVGIEEIEVFI